MRDCGRDSIVTLSRLGQEPDCTPAVGTDAEILLERIRHYINGVFTNEKIAEGKDARTGTHIFRIDSGQRVEVTDTFLDADGGLEATKQRLDRWNLPELLSKLEPDQVLTINSSGPDTRT